MQGRCGTIRTEKVKEYVLVVKQTLAKLNVQFERHGGTGRQQEIVKLIRAKLLSNQCQILADYDQLAELRNLNELNELAKMPMTIEQDKWAKHLIADLSILRNYTNGLIPTVPEPTRKQLLNSDYWSTNIDMFADNGE
jgi:hypothetical protein